MSDFYNDDTSIWEIEEDRRVEIAIQNALWSVAKDLGEERPELIGKPAHEVAKALFLLMLSPAWCHDLLTQNHSALAEYIRLPSPHKERVCEILSMQSVLRCIEGGND